MGARILLIGNNRIGDFVLSTGLLAHLAERSPACELSVVCGPLPAALLADAPRHVTVVAMRKRPFAGHWLALWGATLGRRWDLVVDLRASRLAWFLRAGERRWPIPGCTRHVVEEVASALALSPAPAPRLWISPERRARARAAVAGDRPLLALGPTANWPPKQWPIERFVALSQALTGPAGPLAGARLLVAGAAHERPAAAGLLGAFAGRTIERFGGDLLDTATMLAEARLFVGNDSGLMHIAAAVGVPTIGLFGPSDERRYGPWGARAAAVRTDEDVATLLRRADEPGHRGRSLLTSLTVERAFAAASRLLATGG